MGGKSCAKRKISKVMREWKTKKLKDRGGNVVRKHKQAIAIALGTARRTCGNRSVTPKNKRKSSARKRKSTRKSTRKRR